MHDPDLKKKKFRPNIMHYSFHLLISVHIGLSLSQLHLEQE